MAARSLLFLLAFYCLGTPGAAASINVAVAANFMAPMKDIAAGFQSVSGQQVNVSFGSSGKFFAQISNGAPFQAFFSADQATAAALERAALAVPGTRFTYAVGALALWSSRAGFIHDSPARLRSGQFTRLALANPRLAPYGAAAVQVLQSLDLLDATRGKWVQGENIAQVYQFVSTGNADLGFIALSQLRARAHIAGGSAWIVPAELHAPIRQDAVLLEAGRNNAAAQALLRFVRSRPARTIIESYGYQTLSPAN